MGKKSEPDQLTAPKRKQHRKKREKVEKKALFKKNKKSFYEKRAELRKIKAQKDELRKLGLVSKAFSERIHADEVYLAAKHIGKLLAHEPENAEEELIELFSLIDSGCQVDLRKLSDSYVQLKLHKLFKLLRLKHSKSNPLKY